MLRARIVLHGTIWLALAGALLFASAGRLAWLAGWAFLGLMAITFVLNATLMTAVNPDLIGRRLTSPWPDRGFDRLFATLYVPTWIGFLVLAGVEARQAPPAGLDRCALALGGALHFAGDIPTLMALLENPWAVPTVRIQTESGHRVVATGPYAWVRHPMYAGMLLMTAGWPLVLGSRLAWLPWLAMAALLVYRTACEDRLLALELPGYRDYQAEVPYRLVPGLW